MNFRNHLFFPANAPFPAALLRCSDWRSLFATQHFYRVALCTILLLGFALALPLLDRFPLREDEAIYSFWALHFWRSDPFFLTVWPDKPPLFLWLLALAFRLWGAHQATGRLLNIMLTLLTALLVGATARHWWGRRRGVLATLLYLLNPFVISFAPTIYTDPMLVFTGQLALLLVLTGHSFGAGFWLAAAIMTKQQGVFYVPLLFGALWHTHHAPTDRVRGAPHWHWLWVGLGALVVLLPLIYWDSLRWAVAPSPWDLSVRNYGALQWLPPTTWGSRTVEWAKLLWYFTASWPVWVLLGGAIIGVFIRRGMTLLRQGSQLWWLLLWSLCFLTLHITTSIQIWDRYLLPLAPMFTLFCAWAIAEWRPAALRRPSIALLIALCTLLPPALTAAVGRIPIGGDHGAYRGLPEALAWLQNAAPGKAILYHQRLGWHYQFYLYDQLVTGAYELRWFPNTTYLAANAAKAPAQTRFLIQPDWIPQPDLPLRLAVHQIRLIPQAHFGQMTVYTLENEPLSPCDWCLCRQPTPWPAFYSSDLLLEQTQP